MGSITHERADYLIWALWALSLLALIILEFVLDPGLAGSEIGKLALTFALSLFVIMKAAGFAITAISHYAQETGLSKSFIGLIIISLGTTLPELTTGIFSSLSGKGQLVLGDVLGANIIDATIILGIAAIIAGKLDFSGSMGGKTLWSLWALMLVPIILGADGTISRAEGVMLVCVFLAYLVFMIIREGKVGKLKKDIPFKNIWQDMLVFVGCILALLLSARWLVASSIRASQLLDIPVFLIGLVVVSLGTTVPELVVNIKSVLRGAHSMGVGNAVGSIVVNSLLVIGISSIINPIDVASGSFLLSAVYMLAGVGLACYFLQSRRITRQEGVALVVIYLLFLVTSLALY